MTERTIDVGVGTGLCVAVDLGDEAGVWWWEPGSIHEVGFRLGTHSRTRSFIDVRLVVDRGTMRVAGSTEGVPLVPRSDLEIPEVIGRPAT